MWSLKALRGNFCGRMSATYPKHTSSISRKKTCVCSRRLRLLRLGILCPAVGVRPVVRLELVSKFTYLIPFFTFSLINPDLFPPSLLSEKSPPWRFGYS